MHLPNGTKVAIGSTNPTKLEAVKLAFSQVWPEATFQYELIDAPSDVNEQPLSESETMRGAENRARFVLDNTSADFAVGIEGGMYQLANKWFVSDWACVISRDDRIGFGGTPRYFVPDKFALLVTADFDLSAVLEQELGAKNIGKLDGYAGLTTNNFLTRTTSNQIAIITALSRFTNLT